MIVISVTPFAFDVAAWLESRESARLWDNKLVHLKRENKFDRFSGSIKVDLISWNEAFDVHVLTISIILSL